MKLLVQQVLHYHTETKNKARYSERGLLSDSHAPAEGVGTCYLPKALLLSACGGRYPAEVRITVEVEEKANEKAQESPHA